MSYVLCRPVVSYVLCRRVVCPVSSCRMSCVVVSYVVVSSCRRVVMSSVVVRYAAVSYAVVSCRVSPQSPRPMLKGVAAAAVRTAAVTAAVTRAMTTATTRRTARSTPQAAVSGAALLGGHGDRERGSERTRGRDAWRDARGKGGELFVRCICHSLSCRATSHICIAVLYHIVSSYAPINTSVCGALRYSISFALRTLTSFSRWCLMFRCVPPHHITSPHITSHHITSLDIMSRHVTSHHTTSHHVTSRVTSRHVTSCRRRGGDF